MTTGQTEAAAQALHESRQRWRGFAELSADLAFETDGMGRFTFVWPEGALGWPPGALCGRASSTLLAMPECAANPFRAPGVRRMRVWLRTGAGAPALFAVSTSPHALDGGGWGATRGIALDIDAEDQAARAATDLLRQAAIEQDVVGALRRELHMPRMIGAVLESAAQAMGAAGAAVVACGAAAEATHASAPIPPAVLELTPHMLATARPMAATRSHAVLACPVPARLGALSGLVFWREPAERPWHADERALAASLTGTVRVVLEQSRVQQEMARQARTDPLTGLLNRRAFGAELERRVQRMSHGGTGVLITLDLDGFGRLNVERGHEAGDAALLAAAGELRRVFRPSDLLARLGGDEFGAWLDDADELTAAERAEQLRCGVPDAIARATPHGAPCVTVSIGIAPRRGGEPEDAEALVRRSDEAMHGAKRSGQDRWHVSAQRSFG